MVNIKVIERENAYLISDIILNHFKKLKGILLFF